MSYKSFKSFIGIPVAHPCFGHHPCFHPCFCWSILVAFHTSWMIIIDAFWCKKDKQQKMMSYKSLIGIPVAHPCFHPCFGHHPCSLPCFCWSVLVAFHSSWMIIIDAFWCKKDKTWSILVAFHTSWMIIIDAFWCKKDNNSRK